ncbi:hypothetical protein TNCV_2708561 [Trichonephila clavipes]|nr:hypothetical protein TNCV_2708561 [Trichonephila clavipes]
MTQPTKRRNCSHARHEYGIVRSPIHRNTGRGQKVIESVEKGERKVDVAKAFEIPLSSLSTIVKNKEKRVVERENALVKVIFPVLNSVLFHG